MSCNKISAKVNSGLTLVESVVSIFIVTSLLVGLLSTFYISKSSALSAKHRMAAMNIIKEHMEREIKAGYDGGGDDLEADFYTTVSSADPVQVTIDNRGTASVSDDLFGTIIPDPYQPDNIDNPDGSLMTYNNIPYKIIGFIVTWTEDRTGQVCTERAYCHVSLHP